MKTMFRRFGAALATLACLASAATPANAQLDVVARGVASNAQSIIDTDVRDFAIIVAGADEPGVATAIGAAEQCGSCKILLVSAENRLGGMMGGGISLSDVLSTKSPNLVP